MYTPLLDKSINVSFVPNLRAPNVIHATMTTTTTTTTAETAKTATTVITTTKTTIKSTKRDVSDFRLIPCSLS